MGHGWALSDMMRVLKLSSSLESREDTIEQVWSWQGYMQ